MLQCGQTMAQSSHQTRKGSSVFEDATSRTSSGFAEEFTFRPDTAPGNPREQALPISPLAAEIRSRSVASLPVNLRIGAGCGQGNVSAREILQNGKKTVEEEKVSGPKTIESMVEQQETLQDENQPWYISMLREKEERLLHMGNEINRLSQFEAELSRKDNEIFDLKRQMAQHMATKTTRESRADDVIADLKQRMQLLGDEVLRLAPMEEECKSKEEMVLQLQKQLVSVKKADQAEKPEVDKAEHLFLGDIPAVYKIEKSQVDAAENPYDDEVENLRQTMQSVNADADALRKQFDDLVPEKLTPEDEVLLMRDELRRKDDTINNLSQKLIDIQTDLAMNEGFVNALQRDLQASNNKVMKLVSQVEKAENKMNEAVAEALSMSKKFSDLRESRKHNDMAAENEHELVLVKAALSESQMKIEKMKERMDKQTKEIRESHRKIKKGSEVDKKQSEEIRIMCRDLEDVRRKEQLSRVMAEQISARFERLRSRIIQAVYITPGSAYPESAVSDIILFNAVKKIVEDRSDFHSKLTEADHDFPPLQIEIDATQEEEVAEEVAAPVTPERKSGKGGRKHR